MNIRDFIIDEKVSISEAIKAMNKNKKDFLIVCDKLEVKSILTTDDIQIVVKNGINLNTPVSSILSGSCVKIRKNEPNLDDKIFVENNLEFLPVVDDNGNLVSIMFQNGDIIESALDLPVFLFDKDIYDLKDYIGENDLLRYKERLIEKVSDIKKRGNNSIVIITSISKINIEDFIMNSRLFSDIKLIKIDEFSELTNTLFKLKKDFNNAFILTGARYYSNIDYSEVYNYHIKEKNVITIVCGLKSLELPNNIVDFTEDGKLMFIDENPKFSFWVNLNLYIINQEFFEFINDMENYSISRVIKRIINKGGKVGIYYLPENKWKDII